MDGVIRLVHNVTISSPSYCNLMLSFDLMLFVYNYRRYPIKSSLLTFSLVEHYSVVPCVSISWAFVYFYLFEFIRRLTVPSPSSTPSPPPPPPPSSSPSFDGLDRLFYTYCLLALVSLPIFTIRVETAPSSAFRIFGMSAHLSIYLPDCNL